MTLEQVAASGPVRPITALGADRALTLQIQTRLAAVGLLDPPADGRFGPVSAWALGQFIERAQGISAATHFGSAEARALRDPSALRQFALRPGTDLAGLVVQALRTRGDWICRHPDCINIVYVDGIDPDGTPNANRHNHFEDLRLVIRIDATGVPQLAGAWEATTEPGTYYVKTQKLHSLGAAHVVAGQYKAWSVGTHRAGSASAHEALVQTLPVKITRDSNEDFDPAGDPAFTGLYGINQHWGFDFSREDVRSASAGCLVGRTRKGHREFMALCKADPRYAVNHSYRFMTAVIDGARLRPHHDG